MKLKVKKMLKPKYLLLILCAMLLVGVLSNVFDIFEGNRGRRKQRRKRRQAAREDRIDARQENRQERRLNRIKNQDGRKKFHSFMKPIMKGVSTVGQKAIEGGTNVALLGIKRAEQEASQQLM